MVEVRRDISFKVTFLNFVLKEIENRTLEFKIDRLGSSYGLRGIRNITHIISLKYNLTLYLNKGQLINYDLQVGGNI